MSPRGEMLKRLLFTVEERGATYYGGAFKDLLKVLAHLDRDCYAPEVLLTGGEDPRGLIEALGVNVFTCPLPAWRKGRSWPLIPWAVLRLLKVVRARGVDLIHVNGGYNDVPYAAMAARLAGIPSVLTVRCPVELCEKSRKYRFQWVGRLVLCAKVMEAEIVRQHLVPMDRVKTIYSGIDVDGFRDGRGDGVPADGRDVRREFGIPLEAPLVGVVANLVPTKGYEDLLAALAIASQKIETLYCLCVGGGDPAYRAVLEGLVRRHGLEGYVVFAGYQQSVRPFYEAMDLFVLPSHTEAFGLVLLEAMALALPVVATSSGGIPEVVEDGVTGLLVPPEAPSRLAEAMVRLLADRQARIAMGLAGLARVKRHFSLERQIASLESLYRELLEAPPCTS